MAAEPPSRRATCPSCSKPSRLCLCTRIKNPNLNNSIAVTILQHSLEKNHPLNSIRIAALGLRNLKIVTVSDVNLEARFEIRPIRSDSEMGFDCFEEKKNWSKEKSVFEKSALEPIQIDSEMDFDHFDEDNNGSDEKSTFKRLPIDFMVSKNGVICPDLNSFFDSRVFLDKLAKGFVVKKWQNKLVNGSIENKVSEEFEIVVPQGSALLFPSENSIKIENIEFDVKNLIVLDGTWSKAKRIYSENPWLNFLPHLKLDLEKLSLYKEVRRQPRASYLSSLESIVYALKGLGEESDGLNQLLEVFESMVGDQRRCKDERLSKISMQ